MGKRRRKVARISKRRLPTIYLCPKCGKEAVRVEILRNQEYAIVKCGSCGLTEDAPLKPALGKIDFYCHFTDRFYLKKSTYNR
jgi:transcription elongation factor Elf1